MPPTALNIAGRKFVVIPEKEYRELTARAARGGKAGAKRRRPSRQSSGDVAESARRLVSERTVPADQVFKRLGL